jgi:hypothetical protein
MGFRLKDFSRSLDFHEVQDDLELEKTSVKENNHRCLLCSLHACAKHSKAQLPEEHLCTPVHIGGTQVYTVDNIQLQNSIWQGKVEKILKGSLDLIPSPTSVKIQIMGGNLK